MTTLEEFLSTVEGGWSGKGVSYETPWSPAGSARVDAIWSMLRPAATAVLRYRHAQEAGMTYESLTAIAPGEPPRTWTFDSMNFLPDSVGMATFGPAGLVLERHSPRGTNRMALALTETNDQLMIDVQFIPATAGTTALAVARASLTRAAKDQGLPI